MKILLTGGSGFLGKHLIETLKGSHEIITVGRSGQNNILADLTTELKMDLPQCDLIVHAAGKAHSIPKTKEEIQEFYSVNVVGTANLLNAISFSEKFPKAFILISSVSVYGLDQGTFISETTPLNGNTPYAESKIAAEKLALEWGERHGINVVILRLPLIIGKDAPGNLGAMIKAIRKGYYFRIANIQVRKSMVLAEDIGNFIPSLVDKSGIYNLTDGIDPFYTEFDSYLAAQLGKRIFSIPLSPIKQLAKLGDRVPGFPLNTYRLQKLNSSLTFDQQKAVRELNWSPRPVIGSFKIA
jgi:nucleoside-diphosphate-sugar epimerase